MIRAVGLLLGTVLLAGDGDPWIDVLRDAQLANQERLNQGHALMRIEYTPLHFDNMDPEKITIEVDITWKGEDYLAKIRAMDRLGELLGQPLVKPLNEQPWFFNAHIRNRLYTFNPYSRIFRMIEEGKKPFPILQFSPKDLWFTCCPPSGSNGRPWHEMIGPLPASATGGKLGEIRFVPLGNGSVKQIRTDPDGGVVEIVFSEASGSPLSLIYSPSDPRFPVSRGTWEWKKIGDAFVLDSLRFTKYVPGRPDEVDADYQLKVLDVDLKPVPASLLTVAHLRELLPPDSTVHDDATGRSSRVRPTARISDQELERLRQQLKSRGFLKP